MCSFNVIIKAIACGDDHSVFITDAGTIYAMGSNHEGRLGIGNRQIRQSSSPTLVEGLTGLRGRKIECGSAHTLAIMDNGEVYSWGCGSDGQLGSGQIASFYAPQKIHLSAIRKVLAEQISCGARHSAILTNAGEILMFGDGDHGQLGTGKREKVLTPVKMCSVPDLTFASVACGENHTLILATNGEVWATGNNQAGQLGTGNRRTALVPQKITGFGEAKVQKIAAGYHSGAVSMEGLVYIWGAGVFGEYLTPTIFLGDKNAKMKSLEIGATFACAVDHNGRVFSWGMNNNGELAQGDLFSRGKAQIIERLHDVHIREIKCGGSFALALGKNKAAHFKGELKCEIESLQSARTASDSTREVRELKEKLNEMQANMDNFKNNSSIASEFLRKLEDCQSQLRRTEDNLKTMEMLQFRTEKNNNQLNNENFELKQQVQQLQMMNQEKELEIRRLRDSLMRNRGYVTEAQNLPPSYPTPAINPIRSSSLKMTPRESTLGSSDSNPPTNRGQYEQLPATVSSVKRSGKWAGICQILAESQLSMLNNNSPEPKQEDGDEICENIVRIKEKLAELRKDVF